MPKYRKKGRVHGAHPHGAFRGRQAGVVLPGLAGALPKSITLNGSTVAPDFVYYGRDASPSEWIAAVGEDLTNVNRGTDTTIVEGIPGFPDENAAQGNAYAGDYFRGSGDTVGDVALEDYVLELIYYPVSTGTGASRYLVSKQTETGSFNGYAVHIDHANSRLVATQNDDTTSRVFNCIAHTEDQYNHMLMFNDRDGATENGYSYALNGTRAAPGSVPLTGSLAAVRPISLIAFGGSSNALVGDRLAYAALWKKTDWFSGTNTDEWQTFAAARYARVAGINT